MRLVKAEAAENGGADALASMVKWTRSPPPSPQRKRATEGGAALLRLSAGGGIRSRAVPQF